MTGRASALLSRPSDVLDVVAVRCWPNMTPEESIECALSYGERWLAPGVKIVVVQSDDEADRALANLGALMLDSFPI